MTSADRGDRSYVYLCYNAQSELLYVGVGYSLSGRLSKHKAKWPWFEDVCAVRSRSFTVRSTADQLEEWVISELKPRHNKHLKSRDGGRMSDWENHRLGSDRGYGVVGPEIILTRRKHKFFDWTKNMSKGDLLIKNPESVRRWAREGYDGLKGEGSSDE